MENRKDSLISVRISEVTKNDLKEIAIRKDMSLSKLIRLIVEGAVTAHSNGFELEELDRIANAIEEMKGE